MVPIRIYFKKRINELEDIFKASKESLDVLNELSLEP